MGGTSGDVRRAVQMLADLRESQNSGRSARRRRPAARRARRARRRRGRASRRRGLPRGSARASCRGSAACARPGPAPRRSRPAPGSRPGARRRAAARRRSRRWRPSPRAGSAGSWRGSRPRETPGPGSRAPVRKPRPSTPKATNAMPLSAHHGMTSSSGSRVQSENSLCRALTGCVSCARASSSTVHSEMPRRWILPSPTSSESVAEALLDRHVGVDAVQVVEVEGLEAEPRQRLLALPADRLRPAVAHGAARGAVVLEPALRRDQDVGRAVAQRAADDRLVVAAPVQRRGVEVRDAELDGALQRALGDALVLRIEEVAPGDAHAAEADGGDSGAVEAEAALGQAGHGRTLDGRGANER